MSTIQFAADLGKVRAEVVTLSRELVASGAPGRGGREDRLAAVGVAGVVHGGLPQRVRVSLWADACRASGRNRDVSCEGKKQMQSHRWVRECPFGGGGCAGARR